MAKKAPASPGLAVTRVQVDHLHHDPANVRRHPERNLDAIKASLARFGQVKPIVVDGDNVVRAGNGTLAAAKILGWTEVDVVRTTLKGTEATAYAIADNRTAELAVWDNEGLADTLKALQAEDFDLDAVGFTDDEIAAMCGAVGTDGEGSGSDGDNYGENGTDDEAEDEDDKTRTEPMVFSDEQVVGVAFRWFRENGFPYRNLPVYVSMQQINKLASVPDPLHSSVAYHVADTYQPHRFHGNGEDAKSPVEAFGDDRILTRALRLDMEHDGIIREGLPHHMSNASGTQQCSNFRPGFACKLYREYCQLGATVLDTSTGYGGRLVGFMASGVAGKYIGIDPNVPTHEGNTRMAADLGFSGKVELINLPAEDVPHETVKGRCDFAFTSPPYFRKEHYSDDATQSWKRYGTGDAWRNGFLLPMLELQFAALKPGKFSLVNIADVKIKSVVYPLAAWAVAMAEKAGFKYVRTDEFPMQKRFGAGHDDEIAVEPVLVFQKPERDHRLNGE